MSPTGAADAEVSPKADSSAGAASAQASASSRKAANRRSRSLKYADVSPHETAIAHWRYSSAAAAMESGRRRGQTAGDATNDKTKEGESAPPIAGRMSTIDRTRTAFIDRCVETVADSAVAAAIANRGQPHSRKLLRVLAAKKNILVTTHLHPDPDALASSQAMATLLQEKLPDAKITVSVKGRVGGGVNDGFVRTANVKLTPWDDGAIGGFDAIVLLDCQPTFAYSPLPAGVTPTCVIDHHRGRGRKPQCPFCDIRPDVGATGSIVFSYFLEQRVPISPDLAASLLYAIESDLAGAAGAPGNLDNVALSNLTLQANTRKLYQMRYVNLPQSFYAAYASGLNHAMVYDNALMSHIDRIETLEMPAVIADFLLRFDQVEFALVSGVHENRLIISLRTSSARHSAADMMKRLLRNLGQGGGHRTKGGGFIPLETGSAAEIERKRNILRRRYLRVLGINANHGQRLTPKCD